MNSSIQKLADDLLALAPELSAYLENEFETIQKQLEQNAEDVTNKADFYIGDKIKKVVLKKYPEISIDSEEHEQNHKGDTDIVLRMDPIDGSKHFRSGFNMFSSLISISKSGEVVFSIVIYPDLGVFSAYKNKGAILKNSSKAIKLHVNDLSINKSFVMVESPTSQLFKTNSETYYNNYELLTKLGSNAFRLRNVGNNGISHCYLANGFACAFVDLSGDSKLYDVEGPFLLTKEAGGIIKDLEGNLLDGIEYEDDNKKTLKNGFVAGNPKAVDEIIDLFNSH